MGSTPRLESRRTHLGNGTGSILRRGCLWQNATRSETTKHRACSQQKRRCASHAILVAQTQMHHDFSMPFARHSSCEWIMVMLMLERYDNCAGNASSRKIASISKKKC